MLSWEDCIWWSLAKTPRLLLQYFAMILWLIVKNMLKSRKLCTVDCESCCQHSPPRSMPNFPHALRCRAKPCPAPARVQLPRSCLVLGTVKQLCCSTQLWAQTPDYFLRCVVGLYFGLYFALLVLTCPRWPAVRWVHSLWTSLVITGVWFLPWLLPI